MCTYRTRTNQALVTAGLLTALITGCTSTVPGVPLAEGDHTTSSVLAGPPSGTHGLTIASGYESQAATYAAARAIDPCALHQVSSAAEVTGMRAESLMPGSNLASCELGMVPENEKLSVWLLTTTVGAPVDYRNRQEVTDEQIEGMDFLRWQPPADGRSCRYLTKIARPAGDTPTRAPNSAANNQAGQADHAGETTLDLKIRRDSTEAQPKTACQIAHEYLTKVARFWRLPAVRQDKLTTPSLPIATVDPCAGLSGSTKTMDGPLEAVPQGIYRCLLRHASAQGNNEQTRTATSVSATLSVKWDPRASLNNPKAAQDLRPATVAGKPAVIKQKPGDPANPKLAGDCTLAVITDEAVTIQEDLSGNTPKSVQVAEIQASTCELATAGAESLIASIH
jgi:hypothetical protein